MGQKGRGVIDREDLWAVCREFGVGTSEAVLDDLMATCDADGDGVIDFLEFANFLNWKDRTPIGRAEQRILTGQSPRTWTRSMFCYFSIAILYLCQKERVSQKIFKGR